LLLAGFFAAFFVDLPARDFVLLAAFAGAFFRVAFLDEAFLRAAFFGVAVLFLATFLFDDFLLVTLRFLPVVFLLAGADLRVAAVFLLAAVRFRFLLAVAFAGMFRLLPVREKRGIIPRQTELGSPKQGFFSAFGRRVATHTLPQKRRPGHDADIADGPAKGAPRPRVVLKRRQSFYVPFYITLPRFYGRMA
jgi:hypothetical protein